MFWIVQERMMPCMGIGRVTAISAGVAGALYPWGCSAHAGPETYYLDGVTGAGAVTPEARWLGAGVGDIGYTAGQAVTKSEYVTLFGRLADPRGYAAALVETEAAAEQRIAARFAEEPDATRERRREIRAQEHDRARGDAVEQSRLGRRTSSFRSFEERLEERLRAEPGAEPERVEQIKLELRADTPKPVGFFDVTFSAQKSVSVYHAALLAAGRIEDAEKVLAAHHAGVEAALEYIQEKAGYTRAGYHGRSVDGRPATGKYLDAPNLIAAEFTHHTSREGDPQLHAHLTILNRVRTVDADGKVTWRTLDSRALHKARSGFSAVYEAVMEQKLTDTMPVEFAMRPDGKSRELLGITAAERDAFSVRSKQVEQFREQMIAEYKRRHGPDAEPSQYLLEQMRNQAALMSRRGKDRSVPMAQLVEQWERAAVERMQEQLAPIAARVEQRGVDARFQRALDGHQVDAQEVIRSALSTIQTERASWSRGDLLPHLSRALPDGAARNRELLEQLADVALSGRHGVVQVEGFRLIEAPETLRRADGSPLYQAPAVAEYALARHLGKEQYMLDRARTTGGPALPPAVIEQVIAGTTLSGDQADVVRGLLGQGRQVVPVVGPAGTGKSYTMGIAAQAWKEHVGAPVLGLAVSSVAAEVLNDMGVDTTANVEKWIRAQERIAAGTASLQERVRYGLVRDQLVIVDEASTLDTEHGHEVLRRAERAGAIVVTVGDPEQRGAVGAGGVFRLMSREAQPLHLETVRRFRAEWERPASLRLRAGDRAVLNEYDKRGRFRDGSREEMFGAASQAYVADTIDGREAALIASTNDDAAELSGLVREQLVELGRVTADGVPVSHGNLAGPGDLIQTRENINVWDSTGKQVLNRRRYQVLEYHRDGSITARRHDGLDENGVPQLGGTVRLPADYLAEHVDLGYAGTVDAVQGRTVRIAHDLIDQQTSRDQLYPGMTRGYEQNIGYVVIPDLPGPGHQDDEHGLEVAQERQEQEQPHRMKVLADVLDRDNSERSATETLRNAQDYAPSMPAIAPEWAGVLADETAKGYGAQLAQLLPAPRVEQVLQDPGSLWALLRNAEQQGHDAHQLLADASAVGPVDDARNVTALLYWRVEEALKERQPEREVDPSSYISRTPTLDGPHGDYLREMATRLDARRDYLGQQAAERCPQWAVDHLGPVPDEPLERMQWEQRAGTVEAYRELYGVEDDAGVLGRAPSSGAAEQRIAWEAAHVALGRPEEVRKLEATPDAELRAMVDLYERERAWAPAHVDEHLRQTTIALRHEQEQAALLRAQLEAAGEEQEREQLERQLGGREALAEALAQKASDLELINEARGSWHDATIDAREAAQAAQQELARREAHEHLIRDEAQEPAMPEPGSDQVERTEDDVAEREPVEVGTPDVERTEDQSSRPDAEPAVVEADRPTGTVEQADRSTEEHQEREAAPVERSDRAEEHVVEQAQEHDRATAQPVEQKPAEREQQSPDKRAEAPAGGSVLDMAREVARAREALAQVAERTAAAAAAEEAERAEQTQLAQDRALAERAELERSEPELGGRD